MEIVNSSYEDHTESSTPDCSKGNEAIRFAEWIARNNYQDIYAPEQNDIVWVKVDLNNYLKERNKDDEFTTEQLYKQFLLLF